MITRVKELCILSFQNQLWTISDWAFNIWHLKFFIFFFHNMEKTNKQASQFRLGICVTPKEFSNPEQNYLF